MRFIFSAILLLIFNSCISQDLDIKIGDFFQGGLVGYILQEGDNGYDRNVKHGIIVSEKDLSFGTRWHNGIMTINIIGARGNGIGSGRLNTELIIKNNGEKRKNYAAGIASLYNNGGYNDWYLPSIDELNKLYLNKKILGISDHWYWSSTEGSFFDVWFFDFQFGSKDLSKRNGSCYVRAIRMF